MTSGKVKTLTIEEWETERVRFDAELAQARAVGVGVRLAMRTRLLHIQNKPTEKKEEKEVEEALGEPSKKREAEADVPETDICMVNVSENGQLYAEQFQAEQLRRQEKEDKERKDWEDWQHWYARYLVAKKNLDDHLAVIPSGRHVPTDCLFRPESWQEKERRIGNAPPPPIITSSGRRGLYRNCMHYEYV